MSDDIFFQLIIKHLADAPESQLDQSWRKRCQEFVGTEAQAYDFLDNMHNTVCCSASSFIQTLTNVKAHYDRPGP